jgi:signal transduction histidine kinase
LYIISSILIALAYFSIPILIYYLISKAKNKLPFQKVFWLFLLFILACGFTHVMDALVFWLPAYRVSAIVLFATALVSWMAVYGLYQIVPAALTLKSPSMLEDIIATRTRELAQSNESLLKTNQQLQEANLANEKLIRQKDEFLSIASHELKTPVTSLKGYAHLLSTLQGNSNKEQAQLHDKVQQQITKLTVLIKDLLDVTKVQEGGLAYNKASMNLTEALKEVTEDLQRTAPTHRLVLDADKDIFIHADHDRMIQVINNLVANAVKYSPAASTVLIRLKREDNSIVCSVQDFGLGIAAAELDKIFDKFYRAEGKNMHTYPGLGLGLFIAKDIITKHGGRIWAESEEGKGATFLFSLPTASLNDAAMA